MVGSRKIFKLFEQVHDIWPFILSVDFILPMQYIYIYSPDIYRYFFTIFAAV